MSRALTAEQKLHKKLFDARKGAATVARKGDGGEFAFARFEDVLAEASRLLDEKRIHIVPQVVDQDLTFSRSRPFAVASVVMEFRVIDVAGGGELTLRWSGTADDAPGGKALFKAQTGCEKYFLAKLLRIPFGTDPEEKEESSTFLEIGPEDSEANQVRAAQDKAAEEPQAPRATRPLPESDLPEADWSGLNGERGGEEVAAGA